MNRITAIDCVCLICNAVPGMPCRGASGKTLKVPHLWRTQTAKDELRRQIDNEAIVESLRRQSEFYAVNPRVDAKPYDDEVEA